MEFLYSLYSLLVLRYIFWRSEKQWLVGDRYIGLLPRLHDQANIKRASSKHRANVKQTSSKHQAIKAHVVTSAYYPSMVW